MAWDHSTKDPTPGCNPWSESGQPEASVNHMSIYEMEAVMETDENTGPLCASRGAGWRTTSTKNSALTIGYRALGKLSKLLSKAGLH